MLTHEAPVYARPNIQERGFSIPLYSFETNYICIHFLAHCLSDSILFRILFFDCYQVHYNTQSTDRSTTTYLLLRNTQTCVYKYKLHLLLSVLFRLIINGYDEDLRVFNFTPTFRLAVANW